MQGPLTSKRVSKKAIKRIADQNKSLNIVVLTMQERSEESLSRKPVAIGPRRRLSKSQVHRDTNAEKRDANATGDGDIVNSTDLRQALARQGGALSH